MAPKKDTENSVGCKNKYIAMNFFVVAPCMLIVLSPLFVQLMHTDYYKTVKQQKSFKIIIVAPTYFGLRKSSSGSSQPGLRQSYIATLAKRTHVN